MQYIIIDLEWNQPLSYENRVYREVGDRLIFEMIQIGAVKLNDKCEIIDSISVPIQPTHYKRIHPRIRRMTGLGPEILDQAPHFTEAFEQFLTWCGDDYVLLTWGCDDISVLWQNMEFFGCKPKLPGMYDIQRCFSDVHKLKDRMGLKAAMDMLAIEPDENKSFHNAVNDAWYTGLVFATLPDPSAVLKYTQQAKKLIHNEQHGSHGITEYFESLADALAGETAATPRCPVCGKLTTLEDSYIPQAADKYIALCRCKAHGVLMSRLKLRMNSDGKLTMRASVSKATDMNIAYIHTKALQVRERAARGMMPDPEQALMNADRTNMPFDD